MAADPCPATGSLNEDDLNLITRKDGGAAIEMGILFPFLMLFATGVVDLGTQILTAMAVNNAAQVGAAYIMMNPGIVVGGSAAVATAMTNATGLAIQATPVPTITNGILTVTARATYTPILPWAPSPSSLATVVTIRLE